MFLRIAAMSLLVVWLFGFAPALAVEGPLRLGSDRWPPFTDDGGQPRIAIELVEAALARVGVQAETKIVADFSTVLRDLKEGELDGSSMASTMRLDALCFQKPVVPP